jgi:hypothetical protein
MMADARDITRKQMGTERYPGVGTSPVATRLVNSWRSLDRFIISTVANRRNDASHFETRVRSC